MRHIKMFEASKYASQAKELRGKFASLIGQFDEDEVHDVMYPIWDLVGRPDKVLRYVEFYPVGKPKDARTVSANAPSWDEDAESYRNMNKAARSIEAGTTKAAVVFRYIIGTLVGEYDRIKERLFEEAEMIKETLDSMGYVFSGIQLQRNSVVKMLQIEVRLEELDLSVLSVSKDYHSVLPSAIVKPFELFMADFKVPEERARQFAHLLGNADWSATSA